MGETIQEVLSRASLFLQQHNREPKIAEYLLCHHLQYTKTDLLLNLRTALTANVINQFEHDLVVHVQTGKPIQYMIGSEQFYNRTFKVNEHVLIPRPETEELVQYVLAMTKDMSRPLKLLDVGTGSGAIAITLKLEQPSLTVEAGDISAAALAVARENAERLGAEVSFCQSDFLQYWLKQGEQVDWIVSNPPYIPWTEKKQLADTVRDFEPELALFANDDGLAAYQQIIAQSTKVLAPGGYLAFEIGYQQGQSVKQLLKQAFPACHVRIIQDINGKDRIILAKC